MKEVLPETFSESTSTSTSTSASTAEPIKPPVSESKVSSRPKPPSAAQIAASRSNGKKGTGPRDTTSTKFNATKHGLLAVGITELDDADAHRDKLRGLQHELLPVSLREEFLVESIALEMVRLERARRLEAEFITEVLNPAIHEPGPFAALDHLDEGRLSIQVSQRRCGTKVFSDLSVPFSATFPPSRSVCFATSTNLSGSNV